MKKFHKLLAVLAIGVAVLILGVQVYTVLHPQATTQIVAMGEIEERIEGEAMIIRDEAVLLKNSDVAVSCLVSDGDRVAKGQKIADVYHGKVSPEIQSQLRAVNEKIASIKSMSNQSGMENGGTPDTILKNYSQQLILAAKHGNGTEIQQIRGAVDEVVNRRIASDSENAKEVLEDLEKEKARLENSITGDKKEITASDAGICFSTFDGYEDKVGVDNMKALTPEHLKGIQNNQDEITSYDSTLKIVKGFTWYAAAVVNEGKLPSLKKSGDVSLRFPQQGRETHPVEVVHISEVKDGKAVVLFSSTAYNEAVYHNRFMDVEIILNTYSGLKFMKDAIHVQNQKTGVYILQNDGTATFREVEVLASDEGFTVVKQDVLDKKKLQLYDEVIITDSPIEEGHMVHDL